MIATAMTPELRAAIAALIGAAQNADVELHACIDDPRVPYWVEIVARRNARALAEAVRAVEAALSAEVTQ